MHAAPASGTVPPELRILGPLELHGRDGPVSLGGRKPRCLLAALALYPGEVVPADQLIDVIWGARPPASARANLLTYVSSLRRCLVTAGGAGIGAARLSIEARPPGYLLRASHDALDASAFRALVTSQGRLPDALALWRGPVLADLADDLVTLGGRITALEEERMVALIHRIDADLAASQHYELLGELAALVAEHPVHERLRAQQMLALYRCGRQADALAAFGQLRRQLSEELGIDPDAELTRLHEAILRGDPALQPSCAAAELGSVPRLLPAPPTAFTGRDAELGRLDDLLGAERLAVVCGPPGVGKTALALHWAAGAEQQFPDGTLFADLRGFDPGGTPADPVSVLDMWLRALGRRTGDLPGGLEVRAALLRTALAGRRMLLVLDNAADAAQVRPLLPAAPGCRTLVTSRSRLAGLAARDGASVLPLAPLGRDDAVRLLGRIIPPHLMRTDPTAAAELARLCDGLPLALRIVAERAASRPGSLAELAGQLCGESGRLDLLAAGDDESTAVRSAFWWSYRALPDRAARMFRLLGLFPGTAISVGAAGALAGAGRRETAAVLDQLAGAHLLREEQAGLFGCHDLLRLYAIELGRTEESGMAVRRLLAWYLHSAAAADRLLVPRRPRLQPEPAPAGTEPETFGGYDDALRWCDRERTTFDPLVRLAVRAGEHLLAWQLAYAVSGYLNRRAAWRDSIGLCESGMAAARATGDRHGQFQMLGAFTAALSAGRDLDSCIALAEQAVRLGEELGDRVRTGILIGRIGHSLLLQGKHTDAVARTRQALRIFTELDDQFFVATALADLGEALERLGRPGIHHLEQAITTFRAAGADVSEANALHSLASLLCCRGQLARASELCERALAIRRTHGDLVGQAETLLLAGDLDSMHGKGDQAAAAWREAAAIYAAIGDPRQADACQRLIVRPAGASSLRGLSGSP